MPRVEVKVTQTTDNKGLLNKIHQDASKLYAITGYKTEPSVTDAYNTEFGNPLLNQPAKPFILKTIEKDIKNVKPDIDLANTLNILGNSIKKDIRDNAEKDSLKDIFYEVKRR